MDEKQITRAAANYQLRFSLAEVLLNSSSSFFKSDVWEAYKNTKIQMQMKKYIRINESMLKI